MVSFRFLFEYATDHASLLSLSTSADVPQGSDLRAAMHDVWRGLQRAHAHLVRIPYRSVRVYLQAVQGIYVVAKEQEDVLVGELCERFIYGSE